LPTACALRGRSAVRQGAGSSATGVSVSPNYGDSITAISAGRGRIRNDHPERR
jgi:hypothetical protein